MKKRNLNVYIALLIALCIIFAYPLTILIASAREMPKAETVMTFEEKKLIRGYFESNKKPLIDLPKEDELFKLVKDEAGCELFILLYTKNLPDGVVGLANPYCRIIMLDRDLVGCAYAYTLMHEICHLKYMSGDERYVQFSAFKLLFESQNDHLHNISMYYGLYIIDGYFTSKYDCRNEIAEYMRNNKII